MITDKIGGHKVVLLIKHRYYTFQGPKRDSVKGSGWQEVSFEFFLLLKLHDLGIKATATIPE